MISSVIQEEVVTVRDQFQGQIDSIKQDIECVQRQVNGANDLSVVIVGISDAAHENIVNKVNAMNDKRRRKADH